MGTRKRVNKYPRAFKLMAMERMRKCENVCELAKELGIERSVLYHWRNHLKMIEGGPRTLRYESYDDRFVS